MEICEEMKKLRDYLTANKIEWRDDSDTTTLWMCRTKFEFKGRYFSVINGIGSYGGLSFRETKNAGLLECMINGNEPDGWLTADDVIGMMNE